MTDPVVGLVMETTGGLISDTADPVDPADPVVGLVTETTGGVVSGTAAVVNVKLPDVANCPEAFLDLTR
jgi:hypothetical protein